MLLRTKLATSGGAPGFGVKAKGSLIMTESMAQYTALMVMKHTFGADKMRKF